MNGKNLAILGIAFGLILGTGPAAADEDAADRLDDRGVKKLADICYTMVKPKGTVMVFVLGEQSASPTVNSFVIGDGYRIYQRPQPHLYLPLHRRQNREVLSLMEPLRPINSFIYLHGFREFIFQRN